jgi:phospholipid/cholesterol/gamma-HCH transport system permease protein
MAAVGRFVLLLGMGAPNRCEILIAAIGRKFETSCLRFAPRCLVVGGWRVPVYVRTTGTGNQVQHAVAPTIVRGGVAVNSTSVRSSVVDGLKAWTYYLQDYSLLALQSVKHVSSVAHHSTDLVEQMDLIGVGSLLIVAAALICVGGVVVLNAASQFSRFGETALTGDALSLALLRELGPTFTALLVAGRNATGMTSELGSMIVTEQVDAMRGLGIDPIRKLMTPRVLATVLTLPLLVAVGDCAGLLGGFVVASFTLHLDAEQFWTRALKALVFGDLFIGFSKPLVFGFIISTIGCYQGLRVEGGTAGVGRATIKAFVVSSLAVLIADLFLTRLLLYTFKL